MPIAAASPNRPPGVLDSPVCISPRMNVPVVRTTEGAASSTSDPSAPLSALRITTPRTPPPTPRAFTSNSSTDPATTSISGLDAIRRCTASA
jgi:hypothetical protein